MPVYDYLCGACRSVLEVVHGIHADGPRFCPSCGAAGRMRKVVGAPAVVFKGSGWAKKDRSTAAASRRTKEASKDGKAGQGGTTGEGGSDGGPTGAADPGSTRAAEKAADATADKASSAAAAASGDD
jgi:putative FmdB family regulatory protein